MSQRKVESKTESSRVTNAGRKNKRSASSRRFSLQASRALTSVADGVSAILSPLFDRLRSALLLLLSALSMPLVKFLFVFFFSILVANFFFFLLRVFFLAKGEISQEVHLDYLHPSGPSANFTLKNIDKQWKYSSTSASSSLSSLPGEARSAESKDCSEVFFTPHMEYDFSLSVQLASAARHADNSRCMVFFSLLDCLDRPIASSSRLLRAPHHSGAVLLVDTLLWLPLHVLRVLPESEAVAVDLMNGYQDKSDLYSPAYSVLLRLSNEGVNMGIESIVLHATPRPTGISYLLQKYPRLLFVFLNIILMGLFMLSSFGFFVVGYLLRRSTAHRPDEDVNDDDEDDDSASLAESADSIADSASSESNSVGGSLSSGEDDESDFNDILSERDESEGLEISAGNNTAERKIQQSMLRRRLPAENSSS